MQKGIKQQIKDKFFTSNVFLFFMLLALIWVAISCVKITYKRQQMARETEEINQKIKEIQEENKALAEIKNYFGDPAFLEKEAKRRLNLKKEGEEVVALPVSPETVLPTDEGSGKIFSPEVAESEARQKEKELSNWQKWWIYFFK